MLWLCATWLGSSTDWNLWACVPASADWVCGIWLLRGVWEGSTNSIWWLEHIALADIRSSSPNPDSTVDLHDLRDELLLSEQTRNEIVPLHIILHRHYHSIYSTSNYNWLAELSNLLELQWWRLSRWIISEWLLIIKVCLNCTKLSRWGLLLNLGLPSTDVL